MRRPAGIGSGMGGAMITIKRQVWMLAVLAALAAVLGGCAAVQKEIGLAGSSAARYYQFEDILIPGDLKMDTKRSFVHDAGGFKAGTLYLSGYVDVDSLVAFFSDAMLKDGWQLKSSFRYPKTMDLFEKPKKVCLIIIEEGVLNTRVEVWVSPLL
jgi:hypothetical protein